MMTHTSRWPGLNVPTCGWSDDGAGIAFAWERRFVDCPMCLLELDNVPRVPGPEAHFMRTPRRPDYVPEGHIYTPLEFRPRRRRRALVNTLRAITLAVMIIAAILTITALCVRYTDTAGTPHPPVIVVTPTTTPYPGGWVPPWN